MIMALTQSIVTPCYHCGEFRCRCALLEAAEAAKLRMVHRTARLMRAIDLLEKQIENLEGLNRLDPRLPEYKEKLNNITGALLTHRRNLKGI